MYSGRRDSGFAQLRIYADNNIPAAVTAAAARQSRNADTNVFDSGQVSAVGVVFLASRLFLEDWAVCARRGSGVVEMVDSCCYILLMIALMLVTSYAIVNTNYKWIISIFETING
jgi:hypothetical protein